MQRIRSYYHNKLNTLRRILDLYQEKVEKKNAELERRVAVSDVSQSMSYPSVSIISDQINFLFNVLPYYLSILFPRNSCITLVAHFVLTGGKVQKQSQTLIKQFYASIHVFLSFPGPLFCRP